MKFGTWSYDGQYVTLRVLKYAASERADDDAAPADMDLSFYLQSAAWDILNITAVRHEKIYPGCCGQQKYIDITYYFHLRRKTLFYTANMIFPCVLISLLTLFAFYVPAQTNQKMTLCISILVCLSVFFLLLAEIMPTTSLSVPMMGKYLLFNMATVAVSIVLSVLTLNLHHRQTGLLDARVRWLLLEHVAARLSIAAPPPVDAQPDLRRAVAALERLRDAPPPPHDAPRLLLRRAADNAAYIARHLEVELIKQRVSQEWSHLALVIDRICLWVISCMTVLGTCAIVLQVPTLYDQWPALPVPEARQPLGYAIRHSP